MPPLFSSERCQQACRQVTASLLAEMNSVGHWTGELSTSALATATAVMALLQVVRATASADAPIADSPTKAPGFPGENSLPTSGSESRPQALQNLIANGLRWLVEHQNPDGGWGDTLLSHSNISTTMLCHASLHAASQLVSGQGSAEGPHRSEHSTGNTSESRSDASAIEAAQAYIDRAGGIAAVRARYGKDRTFSVPILTHCALAGLVDWREITPLPFELAALPMSFYKWIRLPVVSYALPALIAIGQARHHFAPSWNPLARVIRQATRSYTLKVLTAIQPSSGGFLEAAPLTSFVTMSLAAIGLADHPVAKRGVEFLSRTVRSDGSWPIDTNLATWGTTLSINALGSDLPEDRVPALEDWLLNQQYQVVHPYTNAAPGGWAWTDLSGGVPDADDTPGAILALLNLRRQSHGSDERVPTALQNGVVWLLDLQNRDGGWPTFCRGWGALPFDRSAADLTAHVIRALVAWQRELGATVPASLSERTGNAVDAGFAYLARVQRTEGSWLPLWFGNQHVSDDENPTYGTARVLAAYRDAGRFEAPPAVRGIDWLRRAQNDDGSWGGGLQSSPSVEETAVAMEILLAARSDGEGFSSREIQGLNWLIDRVDDGTVAGASPIGLYFAKLWYFERLYPLIFTTAALRRAVAVSAGLSCPSP